MTIAVVALTATAAAAADEPDETPDWWRNLRLRGRLAEAFAYRLHDPGDVSKLMTTAWLDGKYSFSDRVNLRVGTRTWYDAVFNVTDRYPDNVEHDQKFEFDLREALLSISREELDVRIGRQQIVWGEAISAFIADIVNPKDFREFILPDYTEIRIPIWALDFTYRLAPGLNFEGVWTPDTRFNKFPKAGAEFEFAPPAYRFTQPVIRLPDNPAEFSVERSEGGFRLSYLVNGWDLALIYYDQADKFPVLFQKRLPQASGPDVIALQPEHPRLHIVGATLSKSIEPIVIRSEFTLTLGKTYETTNPAVISGVKQRDTIDYLIGVDYTFSETVDVSLQLIQKILLGPVDQSLARGAVQGKVTTSAALRVATGFFDNTLNPTVLFVIDANRGDFRMSPRLDYLMSDAVTLSAGLDIFEGPRNTLWGQFDSNDRFWFTATFKF